MDKFAMRVLTGLIFSANLFAAQPILSIVALYKAPSQLAPNSFTAAVYQVTNNTSSLTSFAMKAIAGVTQVTNLPGACQNPIQLNQGQSCQLNLRIQGNKLASNLTSGPIICNNAPQPLSCSQPSQSDSFNLTVLSTPLVQNNWIGVLIAQDPPPADLATYMNQIISLAPAQTQIHFRFPAGGTNYQTYADLINLFRTAYGSSLLIGFHPDASTSSFDLWGCSGLHTPTDAECVLNATIRAMNAIDAIADPQHTGNGFNIYSIEQSYVIPTPSPPTPPLVTYSDIKACLNPPDVPPSSGTCPSNVTIASLPYVKFGSVLPSYGDCTGMSSCEYGTDALDYGYPQYYNLGKQIGPYTALITNGFFPSFTTSCFSPPYSSHLYVVDEDNGSSPYSPQIPCNNPANAFVYQNPVTKETPDVSVASAYVAYPMTQLEPISNIPDTNGATVFITFSGEGQTDYPSLFLGAPGWSLANILQFYTGINADFNMLYQQYPPPDPMFANGIFAQGITPSSLQYAIWNFDNILANIGG